VESHSDEQKLVGPDGSYRYPDFTIDDPKLALTVYWEHLGLLHDPEYRRRWEEKLSWYKTLGIVQFEEAGGQHTVLVETSDDARGAISSRDLEGVVHKIFQR
jgi:hypothetical protein